jgi:hypothetical protein
MKSLQLSISLLSAGLLVFGGAVAPRFYAVSAAQKMKLEELVAKHLEAIGSVEARAKAAARVASGKANFIVNIGGAANLSGSAMFVSAGARFRFGMRFPTPDYTGEDMAFDGSRAASALLPTGGRSPLSVFVSQQDAVLKEGLLGGVLSTAWSLLRLEQTQAKLDYRGLKKLDGRQLHELGYRPRKANAELKVLLYFDPTTFCHVRTRYSFEIGATIGTREASNINPESYLSLTEEFDDFRAVEGLTLPHKYRLQYSAEGRGPTTLRDWTIVFDRMQHNPKIEDELFTIK